MIGRTFLCLALLSASACAAASSGFLLGVDYTEQLNLLSLYQMATDSAGDLYILSNCSGLPPSTCVTKLSPDGATMLWQTNLGIRGSYLAVDPTGDIYVAATNEAAGPAFAEKLRADGTTIVWKVPLGFNNDGSGAPGQAPVAVDSAGRLYVGANNSVLRVKADGSGIDYTTEVPAAPYAIAVSTSGSAWVSTQDAIIQLAPDGTLMATVGQLYGAPAIAVAPNGDLVVYGSDSSGHILLQRLSASDPSGLPVFSEVMGGWPPGGPETESSSNVLGLGLDSAGNAYIVGQSSVLDPMRNSLATCSSSYDSSFLSVFAPDGSLLQSTYIPGAGIASNFGMGGLAVGPNSAVFVVAPPAAAFVPTQASPVPDSAGFNSGFLARFSPDGAAQPLPLACVGNAATYGTGPLAPGEIVALFGNGLGPAQGIVSQASLANPFPKELANVQVTFDGTSAPLLYVQDGQINVVAPWSLAVGQNTEVCVSYNDAKTNCLQWPVVQTSPGVLMADSSHARALNQDGTINSPSNPAKTGSIVSVFAIGMGPITPAQADGSLVGLPLPVNELPVPVIYNAGCLRFECTITQATVEYEGPAPFELAGLTQINFQAPPPPVTNSILTNGGTFNVGGSNSFMIYVAGP